jgi:hypothetical protein
MVSSRVQYRPVLRLRERSALNTFDGPSNVIWDILEIRGHSSFIQVELGNVSILDTAWFRSYRICIPQFRWLDVICNMQLTEPPW